MGSHWLFLSRQWHNQNQAFGSNEDVAKWDECHTSISRILSAVQYLILTEFPFSFSTVFILLSSNILSFTLSWLADDILCTSQKSHHHHHLSPNLNLQPFLCLTCPYICIYTLLSHWEIFTPGVILILIPLPVLYPMACHAQGPPCIKIVPSHTINLSLSCDVTLSPLLCSCFTYFVLYHHGTSLYTWLPEPDSWTL